MSMQLFSDPKFTIYNSSAGSGKTFTLATEFIRFALQDEGNYKRILAITFTNKATSEMKERILSFLQQLSESSNPMLLELIVAKTGLSEKLVQTRSKRVLHLILHHYSFFTVNTIDSFFQRLIKGFAVELNIYINYEILLDSGQVVEWAVDEMLERSASDKKLKAWIEKYVWAKIEDESSVFSLKELFSEVSKQVFSNVYQDKIAYNHEHLQDLDHAEEIRHQLYKKKVAFEHKMEEFSQKGLQLYQQHGVSSNDFKYKNSGVGVIFDKISKTTKKYEFGTRVMDAYHDPGAWLPKGDAQNVPLVENHLHPLLVEVITYANEELSTYQSSVQLLKNIYAFGITNLLEALKEEYVKEHNFLLLSDSAAHISGLIKEEEDAPFLYDKIGTYFNYVLLDEAQDTSLSQWRNLLPLVKNCLAEGGEVVVVGDVKQSIYRWRGGDVDLLVTEIENTVRPFPVSRKFLSTNYRSYKHVVQANNLIIEEALRIVENEGNEGIRHYYQEYAQEASSQEEKGFVQYAGIPSGMNEQKFKDNSLDLMLSTIHGLIDAGYPYADITVLVRYNKESAVIAEFLKKKNIPVLSSEALYIQHSDEVQFIIALLKALTNKKDHISKYAALQYLNITIDNVKEARFLSFLPTSFSSIADELSKGNTYTAVEGIIASFDLGARSPAYLVELLDLVVEFSVSGSSSIPSFLHYWDEKIADGNRSVSLPDGQNAINIVSIHRSKGLEYDIVIIPFAGWSITPHRNDIFWFADQELHGNEAPLFFPLSNTKKLEESTFKLQYKKQLMLTVLDELNALYVAITRAVKELHVFYELSGSDKSNGIRSMSSLLEVICQPHGERYKEDDPLWTIFGKREDYVAPKQQKVRVTNTPTEVLVSTLKVPVKLIKGDKEEDARTEGRVLHAFFEYALTAADIDHVTQTFILSGIAEQETIHAMAEMVSFIYELPQFNEWLTEYEQLSEREIYLAEDNAVYRPDRLFIRNNEVIVVDFKIRFNADSEAKYRKQVLAYKRSLLQLGYDNVLLYLIYVEENRIQEVN